MPQSLQVSIAAAARNGASQPCSYAYEIGIDEVFVDLGCHDRLRRYSLQPTPRLPDACVRLVRCEEVAEGFEKCRKTPSGVESCAERSTDHLLGFVLPVRNLRSLKYLTTAQAQPQPWHLTCLY